MGGPSGEIEMVDARDISSKQKQIAVSEFFEKNKHFLGFDSLQRSLITAVKEAVDNSLDACEEARILPEINVEINRLKGDDIELISQDNGPGIPRDAIENVFGKFLLGSRFHAIRQTRGQQGIGITGVVMYSQLTTGAKTRVISKIKNDSSAVFVELGLDTRKNKAIKSKERREIWIDQNTGEEVVHGLKIATIMKAKYQRGKQSVFQYLRMTSIVNPHATISLTVKDRDGEIIEEARWIRTSERLPRVVEEIKPHPHGIQLGTLQRMLRESEEKRMTSFLRHNFSGVSMRAAKELLSSSEIEEVRNPKRISSEDAKKLVDAFQKIKLLPPPTDCLSPIDDLLIKKGLSKAIDSRFASTVTRLPTVSQGNPFQIEVGLVFGGDLSAEGPIEVLRFANRVPLMYQQGGCALTKAIESINWKQYGLDHPGGKGLPKGAAAVLIHLASTNVQFTSEAKEAVSDNEEVSAEIRKGLLEVGRGLKNHLKKNTQRKKAREKFELVNVILPEIAKKTSKILGREEPDLAPVITQIMNAVFCEEELGWDKEKKLATCSIKIFNYTARARAYTILLKWPESDMVSIVENSNGGRKEARGIWAWRLDTLNPGTSTTIRIALSGLSKGDWTDTDVFFRGNGDIIGATKIDEKILEEIRKTEALSAVRKEIHEVNNIPYDITEEKVAQVITDSDADLEKIDIFSKFEEEEV
ncbi:TPA: DNA topoisomerase VI subunit B [Candidatus Thalassarchaeaceae archaeon]|jgi:DNA topoisomerase-6 subunit B|nr:DNA topoisomerase VI subunit B [Euryarchaeota archaeon]DAC62362.1 MAG TPA: DNA topoisomerase VI subunit B [Candidatus Poseidoniales archaeon]HIH06502.1 DNA topoisomerase VI subunit B [Candidatus Thalassarchaeaceae archaeon]MDC0502280.1 DNA topoisomerase VI subunit B [Euryarchaeota archaeon]DAC66398.1 MAG TPA: DNA topoisomerase VI subunit B [Candidatus Poseidoniales archaeon]